MRSKSVKHEIPEKDLYRDTNVRYLGYSNEVGEAFRRLVSRTLVNLSYGVALAYVLADTADKALKEKDRPGSTMTDVSIKAGDVLTWQLFASIIIPGYTINRISYGTSIVVHRLKIPHRYGKFIPTAIGLLSIPIIISPIDRMVDYAMDRSYRKVFTIDENPLKKK